MSGLPKTSARNTAGACTGDWAGHTDGDARHCVCWWDGDGPCCACGQSVEQRVWAKAKPWR